MQEAIPAETEALERLQQWEAEEGGTERTFWVWRRHGNHCKHAQEGAGAFLRRPTLVWSPQAHAHGHRHIPPSRVSLWLSLQLSRVRPSPVYRL